LQRRRDMSMAPSDGGLGGFFSSAGAPGGWADKLNGFLDSDWAMKKALYEKAGLPAPNALGDLLSGAKVSTSKNGSYFGANVGETSGSSDNAMKMAMMARLFDKPGGAQQASGGAGKNPYVDTIIRPVQPGGRIGPTYRANQYDAGSFDDFLKYQSGGSAFGG
jgi:hypothetical protein